ncbi:MAG: glycosyltransferase family 4 protein [Vicinamibacterales bacterium]
MPKCMRRIRVGIVCDLLSERWPSMDLVGDMLLQRLASGHGAAIEAVRLRPDEGGASRGAAGGAGSATRMFRRYWSYRCWLARRRDAADVFHVVDHSYAHLVHVLPPGRAIVTCHDTDAFRPLIVPGQRESRLPRAVVRHVARGLARAAVVTCDSQATRADLVSSGLARAERLVVVPMGVHPSCTAAPEAGADSEASRMLDDPRTRSPISPDQNDMQRPLDLLHVGSTIPRKRIDVLLRVVAAVRADWPSARLVRVGGSFTAAQQRMAEDLGVAPHIVSLPFLERRVLAAVYRRAALVLLPSEREGFGLPVVEAMACGTPVVASDLPVLREVGGDAASYCPPGDVVAWRETIRSLLQERCSGSPEWQRRISCGLAQAAKFSWDRCAGEMAKLYCEIVG